MIIHIAFFRWKPDVTESQITAALQQVRRLKPMCGGILDIWCGQNSHPESKGFTHGVVVVARDQQALDGYRRHPAHADIARLIEAMEADGLGFDFNAGEG